MQLFLKVYIFTVSLNVEGQFHFQSLLGSVFVLKNHNAVFNGRFIEELE